MKVSSLRPILPGMILAVTAVLAVGLAAAKTRAATIGFEGVAPADPGFIQGVNPYEEAGFRIRSGNTPGPFPPGGIFEPGALPLINTNGTATYSWLRGTDIVLETINLINFNLESIDFANTVEDRPTTIQVTGYFDGGGTNVLDINPTDTYTSTDFNWNNLTRVELLAGADFNAGMDNIRVQAVPEPTGLALGGMVLLACLAIRRR